MSPRLKALLSLPLPFVLFLGLALIASAHYSQNARLRLEALQKQDARLQHTLSQQASLAAYAQALDLEALEAALFFKAPSLTIAQANAQNTLTHLARLAKLSVISTRFKEQGDENNTITIIMALDGTLDQLSAFLIALEDSTPHLRVTGMGLNRMQRTDVEIINATLKISAPALIAGEGA